VIPPRSLRWRLALSMFAATAAIAVAFTLNYQRSMHGLLTDESDRRLATQARQVAAAAVLGTLAHSETLLQGPLDGAMSLDEVTAVAVYDGAGALVAGRAREGAAVPPWRRAEDCVAIVGGLRCAAPVRSTAGLVAADPEPFYDGPPPAASGGAVAGWLVLDVTTAARTAAERQITARAGLLAGVALVLALGVAWFIARQLTSPLRALGSATRAIGKGRFDAPLPRATYSEVAQLAEDFRGMTAALEALDGDNRRYRGHLEEMVASRTRELEEAYQRVKAMAEAKDQFVATVSHDFRSPLAIVLSSVQTVLSDPAMPEDVRARFLGRAERHCKRLGALVSDLLDLARIENRESIFERTSLREVVEEHVEGARSGFEERGVTLRMELGAGPFEAEVDRALVGRALSNLLDNALKFTPPPGAVTVTLARADGVARLVVADTGPGIPEEEREHVFERFFQGREGQALGSGSGLGLAIVAGVARRHGGSVAVAAAPGGGSTFELVLPVARG
jgi:signal transduction histidine kinase